ncbi:Hypothetical predicted protein [Paramuricea clavata]|uniref:Uncharacterized protein n=1 Tax=Paramuricea clavata TaxID=317549 RepID=A0A7D9HSE6_PARCT|nr:Hypothetical predicted protein [Paramuricea clavata]
MNKLFVVVFVVAIGASYGLFLDNLPNFCKADKDCRAHTCCAFGLACLPKLRANMPCGDRFSSLHKCGCDDGLECQVTQVINVNVGDIEKVVKIRQCRAAEEKVIPRKVDYEADEPRQKRLLSGIISGGINTLLRKCSEASACGDKRCCASLPLLGKRCILPFILGFPCPFNGHCCGEGLECRSVFTVSNGNPGGPTKKPVDLKFCRRISDPVTPPIEVDEE